MWTKISDDFFRHPKVVQAGRDARDLFLVGLAHANGHLTDGFIASQYLRRLGADAEIEDAEASARRLVDVGLWEKAEGGWIIHGFLEYNPCRADVEAERARTAERQQQWRDRKRTATTPKEPVTPHVRNSDRNGVTTSVTNSGPVPVPEGYISTALQQPYNVPAQAPGCGSDGDDEAALEDGLRRLAASEYRPVVSRRPGEAGTTAEPPPVKRRSSWPWLTSVPARLAPHADRFEAFYAAYPRKEAPTAAWAAWQKIAVHWSDELGDAIDAGLQAHLRSAQWADRAHIPHPATWLNQRRWESDPPSASEQPSRASPLARFPPRETAFQAARRRNLEIIEQWGAEMDAAIDEQEQRLQEQMAQEQSHGHDEPTNTASEPVAGRDGAPIIIPAPTPARAGRAGATLERLGYAGARGFDA